MRESKGCRLLCMRVKGERVKQSERESGRKREIESKGYSVGRDRKRGVRE